MPDPPVAGPWCATQAASGGAAYWLGGVGRWRPDFWIGVRGRGPDISLARVRSREDAHGVAAAGGVCACRALSTQPPDHSRPSGERLACPLCNFSRPSVRRVFRFGGGRVGGSEVDGWQR